MPLISTTTCTDFLFDWIREIGTLSPSSHSFKRITLFQSFCSLQTELSLGALVFCQSFPLLPSLSAALFPALLGSFFDNASLLLFPPRPSVPPFSALSFSPHSPHDFRLLKKAAVILKALPTGWSESDTKCFNTRNFPIAVPPDPVVIFDESGSARTSFVGPYTEGQQVTLICDAFGGESEIRGN